ncbi:hypothetical protein BDR03DRAFT_511077 [Suillus americanus]|nr:hypothetical protein BDR03DRAFT_511077 [Suillus americanus]
MFRILQLGLSLKSCTTLFAFNTYIGGIILFCAESLFMRRVWAVMGRRWLIVCCNPVLFMVPVVVTLTLYNSSSTIVQSPFQKVASCYASKQSHIVIVAYSFLVIVEIEILSFMLYHSWRLYREHGNDIPLVRILVRHNMFYFACGLSFSAMAVVVVVTLPASYSDAVSELQFMIHGILATRMHRELYNTAHHTEETSTGDIPLPLFLHQLRRRCNLIIKVLRFTLEKTRSMIFRQRICIFSIGKSRYCTVSSFLALMSLIERVEERSFTNAISIE